MKNCKPKRGDYLTNSAVCAIFVCYLNSLNIFKTFNNKERIMPILVVLGLPEEKVYNALKSELRGKVAGTKGLGLTKNQVSVHVIKCVDVDLKRDGITVFVKGLFGKLGRTPEVRNRLAVRIKDYFSTVYGQEKPLVECLIDPPFDPRIGFASTGE